MTSLFTSHASIGDSTIKDGCDMTNSSFGGPEDFTLNIIENLRRNKPSFKHTRREQLTESSILGAEGFAADTLRQTRRRQDSDSSQRSKGRVVAFSRRASNESVKITRPSQSYSPTQSPSRRDISLLPTVATNGNGQSERKESSSTQSATPSTQAQRKADSITKEVKATSDGFPLDNNPDLSVSFEDGEIRHKTLRAGALEKSQPTVSDDEEEYDREAITESLSSLSLNRMQTEPTMSLPLGLPEDDITRPLGESTQTQHTLDSALSSKEQTLEDAFDFATRLAHRIQRTPASAKKPEAEYSINLSADASELLPDGACQPETFPLNESLVRDRSDPKLAFADRIPGVQSDNASNTQRPLGASEVDEVESLRQQLQQSKAALAQKEETINVLRNSLSAKKIECDELHNVLQTKSSAAAAAESREGALQDALRAAEQQTVADANIAAERFAIVKGALIAAEDEAAVAMERAQDAVAAAEAKAASRGRRLEKEVNDLTASARAARAEAKRARTEQAEREALWVERSEVLLAECDRRGRALLVKIGERELPGVRDEKGRQAYRYQRGRDRDKADAVRRGGGM